jgi:hypothetical protein
MQQKISVIAKMMLFLNRRHFVYWVDSFLLGLGWDDGSSGTIPGGYPGQIEDPEARDRALNVEIQNGRAAMLGVTGSMMHSCLDSCDHHFFYPITHA